MTGTRQGLEVGHALILLSGNTKVGCVTLEHPRLATRAPLSLEVTGVGYLPRRAFRARLDRRPRIDHELCPALQAHVRAVIADAHVQLLVVGMVGVLLLPRIVDVVGVAVGPRHNGLAATPADVTVRLRHGTVPPQGVRQIRLRRVGRQHQSRPELEDGHLRTMGVADRPRPLLSTTRHAVSDSAVCSEPEEGVDAIGDLHRPGGKAVGIYPPPPVIASTEASSYGYGPALPSTIVECGTGSKDGDCKKDECAVARL